MSTAANRNFGLAQRERERRIAMSLDDPGGVMAVSGDPGWDAFFGSLHEKEANANAAGYGFRADLSGIGRDGGDPGFSLGRLTPQERASIVGNMALGKYNDQENARKFAEKGAELGRMDDIVGSLQQSYDGSQIDTALSSGGTREETLAALPGHLRPQLQALWAKQDAEAQGLVSMRAKDDLTRAQATKAEAEAQMAVSGALSPEALDDNAKQYLKTGVMPVLGMKDPGNRAKILNRAAEMARTAGGQGADIAANKAGYKADSGSLTAMQKQRDAIGAFEGTAGKNIDLFLSQAGKIVDTGSPMANIAARMVSGKMLGSPDQAAYDAARQVAINEIAKITSNPTLAGQLSDSARHEVEAFNPSNATLAQTVAVMRILKQDMGNRVSELDRQIGEIKGRIAGPGGAPAAAPVSPAAAPAAGGRFDYKAYLAARGGK